MTNQNMNTIKTDTIVKAIDTLKTDTLVKTKTLKKMKRTFMVTNQNQRYTPIASATTTQMRRNSLKSNAMANIAKRISTTTVKTMSKKIRLEL